MAGCMKPVGWGNAVECGFPPCAHWLSVSYSVGPSSRRRSDRAVTQTPLKIAVSVNVDGVSKR
jgi:hypothetical protein